MSPRAPLLAASVNGLVTLLLPAALLVPAALGVGVQGDPPVRPTEPSLFQEAMAPVVALASLMLPLAGLAAWRTWVHARRWTEHGSRSWQGVLEAGAVGVLLALMALAVPTFMRPHDAPPYLIVYGGLALGVGLACGLVLQMTAMIVLASCGALRAKSTASPPL